MSTKRKIVIAVVVMFLLNITVTINSQLDSDTSLSGIVNSAFAEKEDLGLTDPEPSGIMSVEEEEDLKLEDESIVDYILNLFN